MQQRTFEVTRELPALVQVITSPYRNSALIWMDTASFFLFSVTLTSVHPYSCLETKGRPTAADTFENKKIKAVDNDGSPQPHPPPSSPLDINPTDSQKHSPLTLFPLYHHRPPIPSLFFVLNQNILKLRYNADFTEYEPFVVPHKTNPKLLYCTLTGTELNRIPEQVESHISGKRFRNRQAEMEGLKQSQRLPAAALSDEEFWVRAL